MVCMLQEAGYVSRLFFSMSRVYFGRLPRDCRERDVEDLAREFGRVRDVRMLSGFAFVEFADRRDASDAIHELDGTRFMGERYNSTKLSIIVELAKSGGERRDRRGRSRSPRGERRGKPPGENRLKIHGLPDRTSWQVCITFPFPIYLWLSFG